jgi:hypothetical protein
MAPPEITAATVLAKIESLLAITRELISSVNLPPEDTSSKVPSGTAKETGTNPKPATPAESKSKEPEPDPFKSLVDATTVLRAQATKLGLMLVNKPLGPVTVHGILADIEGRILPTLVAAAMTLLPRTDIYGWAVTHTLKRELEGLLLAVVLLAEDAQHVFLRDSAGVKGKGKGKARENKDAKEIDVMVTVGKLFAECDDVVEFARAGVVKTNAARAKDSIDLFEDGLNELSEWRDKVVEDRLDDEDDPFDVFPGGPEQEEEEENQPGPKPEQPPKEELLASVTKALNQASLVHKLMIGLYKRRIRKFPFQAPPYNEPQDEEAAVARMVPLSELLDNIDSGQGEMDDLAMAFYTFRMDGVTELIDDMTMRAHKLANAAEKTWAGERDDFSDWISLWRRLFDGIPPRIIQQPENSLDSIVKGVADTKLDK